MAVDKINRMVERRNELIGGIPRPSEMEPLNGQYREIWLQFVNTYVGYLYSMEVLLQKWMYVKFIMTLTTFEIYFKVLNKLFVPKRHLLQHYIAYFRQMTTQIQGHEPKNNLI